MEMKNHKWYDYDNLMSWDKDDLATTIIEMQEIMIAICQLTEVYEHNANNDKNK